MNPIGLLPAIPYNRGDGAFSAETPSVLPKVVPSKREKPAIFQINYFKLTMTPTVADVMSRDLIVVRPETPLREAIQILAEKRISGLPVVDDENRAIGVISQTDLMWQETGVTPPAYIMILDSVIYLESPAKYERELHKALGQTVGEVMTSDPITVQPNKPLREAAQLMHERNIHRLLVIDEAETLVGIVTRGDVIRFMAAHP